MGALPGDKPFKGKSNEVDERKCSSLLYKGGADVESIISLSMSRLPCIQSESPREVLAAPPCMVGG